MAAPNCMAAGAAISTGRSTSCRAARSAATSGASSTARSTTRTIRLPRTIANAPGRDLWKGTGGCFGENARDRRVPNFDTVDPAIKPMSQDSFSAGFDYEVNSRTVATVHYVHNNLNRTIEDLGALVGGNEVYLIANPGEGQAAFTPTSFAPLTPTFATPKPKRQYDAVELGLSRRFADRWFASAQPHHQPPLRQLRGHLELGRNPHADHWRGLSHGAAAGGIDLPPGRQREPRVGLRRTDVRLARQSRHARPPGHRSPGGRSSCTARTTSTRNTQVGLNLLRRQRHADDHLREHGASDGALRGRARRHGPHPVLQQDRPACLA